MIRKSFGLVAAFLITLAFGANQAQACYACDGGTTQPPAQQQTWTAFGIYGTTDGGAIAGTNATGQVTPRSTLSADSAGRTLTGLASTVTGSTTLCPGGCGDVTMTITGNGLAQHLSQSAAGITAVGTTGGIRADASTNGAAWLGITRAVPAR